jgi:hypothetical protein
VEYTHLGRSGLSVSRLVLGTMNFGPETSEQDSHTIMDRAHDFGSSNFAGWHIAQAQEAAWSRQARARGIRLVITVGALSKSLCRNAYANMPPMVNRPAKQSSR